MELHRRLGAACLKAVREDYEIVLVDDGSHDATWEIIERLSVEDPKLVAVRLARNHGHQVALSCGLHVCRGEVIFILDADLQDPPELLPAMLKEMEGGVHVVYGRRTERHGETWFKRSTADAFYRILNRLVEVPIPADVGDFRLMSRQALDALNEMPEHHRFIRGMVAWIGLKQKPFDYSRDTRYAGETKYPLRRMIRLALDAITGFSIKPLRVASYMGFVFALLSVLMVGYVLINWLFFETVSGWASVMVIVLVLGTVQLFVLGVIGEYLGRMFIESKRRPVYVIDRVISQGKTIPLPRQQAYSDRMLAERSFEEV